MLGYFGEQFATPCGNCDAGVPVAQDTADSRYTIGTRVAQEEWSEGTIENGQITVVFDSVGYKTLAAELVIERDLLTVIGA